MCKTWCGGARIRRRVVQVPRSYAAHAWIRIPSQAGEHAEGALRMCSEQCSTPRAFASVARRTWEFRAQEVGDEAELAGIMRGAN